MTIFPIIFTGRVGYLYFPPEPNPAMYCLQWLIPVLLIPKPVNPALLYNHVVFIILYLFSFFIERKPCTICSLVLLFFFEFSQIFSQMEYNVLNWLKHQIQYKLDHPGGIKSRTSSLLTTVCPKHIELEASLRRG
jgi:hypothetical protein